MQVLYRIGGVRTKAQDQGHISPLERLFVLKILSRTQQTTKVKKFVGFSLKRLCCIDPVLLPLKAVCTVGPFPADSAHAHYMHVVAPSVLRFSAFIDFSGFWYCHSHILQ